MAGAPPKVAAACKPKRTSDFPRGCSLTMRGHARALVGILASQWLGAVVSVGNAPGIVPFAYDQDVVMKVNGHPLSGIPEEYVAGRVDVRGRGALCPGGSLMFEVVKYPKYGQFGWNNTGSGEFIYSPRDYQALTTNHGVEAEEAVPGCKWDCENCPNYPTIPGVSIGNAGPNQPVADPTATAVCNGHMTTCDGFRSTLRDSEHPEQERYVPLSSVWGSRWVSGYICPEVTEAQTKEYLHHRDHRFSRNLNDMDQEVRARVECRDIPPRLCVAHMADVPSDSIKFRVVNGFGISNIGEVRIKFERNDRSDFVLKFTIMIGAILAIASCTGLLRVISLQLVLHPEYSYKSLRSLAGFCPPTEDPFIPERSAHDFRPDWLNELEAIWPPPGYVERKQKALRDKELRRLGDALHDREMKAKANKGHENRVHGHRGKPAGVMQTLEKELEDMVHNAVDDIIHPSHILHGHHRENSFEFMRPPQHLCSGCSKTERNPSCPSYRAHLCCFTRARPSALFSMSDGADAAPMGTLTDNCVPPLGGSGLAPRFVTTSTVLLLSLNPEK